MPVAGGSIRDILMRRVYQPYAQILPQWLVFGPSGHRSRPEGLVIENYTLPAAGGGRGQPPHQADRAHRTGCAASTTRRMPPNATARPATRAARRCCPTRSSRPSATRSWWCTTTSPSRVEDWEFKRRRGRGDSLEPYPERVFADVAGEATIEDARALRFVPRLRALLRS